MFKKIFLTLFLLTTNWGSAKRFKLNLGQSKKYPSQIQGIRENFLKGIKEDLVQVEVGYNDKNFTLHVRTQDIYVLGIDWLDGDTYYFNDHGIDDLKKGIKILPFGGSYSELWPKKEKNFKLDFSDLSGAPKQLKDFDSRERFKKAAALLIITVPESIRFNSVTDFIYGKLINKSSRSFDLEKALVQTCSWKGDLSLDDQEKPEGRSPKSRSSLKEKSKMKLIHQLKNWKHYSKNMPCIVAITTEKALKAHQAAKGVVISKPKRKRKKEKMK